MENLNAEQVKKWLEICAEDTPYPDQSQALLDALALISSQEQKIKELTEQVEKQKKLIEALTDKNNDLWRANREIVEENSRLIVEVDKARQEGYESGKRDNVYGFSAEQLAKKCERLAAENERLKNTIVCKIILPDEKVEEIKNECLSRVELDIKAIQADTVEKIKLMFAVRFGTYTHKDMTPITEVFRLIEQFSRELKGE